MPRRSDPGPPGILFLAAASSADALQEIGARFERETAERVIFSFAASNVLARQILAGAPADLFLSADRQQMDRVAAAGLVRPEAVRPLLSNQLVVIVQRQTSNEAEWPAALSRVPSLALADPVATPAGVYARHWLEATGRWDALRAKMIPTLDVRAALAAVASGNAAAAIVYRTDAAASERVRVVYKVPLSQGPQIVYPIARLTASRHRSAAALFDFVSATAARAIFSRHGFIVL